VNNGVGTVHLFAVNDEITLEYNDRVLLHFTPDDHYFIPDLQAAGQYVRDTAIVNIIDNDSKLYVIIRVIQYFHSPEELQINLKSCCNTITEGMSVTHELEFQRNQEPFSIIFTPVTVPKAISLGFNLTSSLNSDNATAGLDFSDDRKRIEVPASADGYGLKQLVIVDVVRVIDDDINEIDQTFVVVAEIGPDVPDRFVCFQSQPEQINCGQRHSATQITIVDNDPMIIGFSQESQTVSESDASDGEDYFIVEIPVSSQKVSEQYHIIRFRYLEPSSNATTVGYYDYDSYSNDAIFGNSVLEDSRTLRQGENVLQRFSTTIRNDFLIEDQECFVIAVVPGELNGYRQPYFCNDTLGYYCKHTICINDDDEPFVVAFVRTAYTVWENAGSVEVCVNLTRPNIDIREETITVYVTDHPSSIHIPWKAQRASKLGLFVCFQTTLFVGPDYPTLFGEYTMVTGSDYAQQTHRTNALDNEVISAWQRVVCYNQTIYDDDQVEDTEYAGLSLGIRWASVVAVVSPPLDQTALIILDDDNPLKTNVSTPQAAVAGQRNLIITCTVIKTKPRYTNLPSALWLTVSHSVLSAKDISNATTAISTLKFTSLHTSNAGQYICQGKIQDSSSQYINSTSPPVSVTVILPSPNITLVVSNSPLYEGTSVTLICTATLPPSVDTDVNITVNWTPATRSERATISSPSTVRSPFTSTLTINPLIKSDSGLYYCEATAHSSSPFILSSNSGRSSLLKLSVTGTLPYDDMDASTASTTITMNTTKTQIQNTKYEYNMSSCSIMYPTDSNILHNSDCSACSTTAIAISGGLVGGAAVLFIVITASILLAVFKKKLLLKQRPETRRKTLKIYANEAYNEVKQQERGGMYVSSLARCPTSGGDVEMYEVPMATSQSHPPVQHHDRNEKDEVYETIND
jgi:hypothetical protein